MLKLRLIRLITNHFSSLVLLIKKKDGTWHFYADYQTLNTIIIKYWFPFPTVNDMLDEFYGTFYFTKLDLKASYHQVWVHLPNILKTTFCTHDGHYEYLVMPFDLCNTPSIFQAIMNSIFRPYLCKFVLVFYDILIYKPNWTIHLEHV